MKYQDFISLLNTCETSRFKALSLPGCCAMDEISAVFQPVLPAIAQQLIQNLDLLCTADKAMLVIGMQVGPPMIESTLPLRSGRIYSLQNPRQHFCVILQYLLVTAAEIARGITSWYGSETLMIDFTTGTIFDIEHYLATMFAAQTSKGICYGEFESSCLQQAWQQYLLNKTFKVLAKTVREPRYFYGANQLALA